MVEQPGSTKDQKSGKIIIMVKIWVILQRIFLNVLEAGALLNYLRWE